MKRQKRRKLLEEQDDQHEMKG
jgi:hypothetical protein